MREAATASQGVGVESGLEATALCCFSDTVLPLYISIRVLGVGPPITSLPTVGPSLHVGFAESNYLLIPSFFLCFLR